jgi:hypothetical protein
MRRRSFFGWLTALAAAPLAALKHQHVWMQHPTDFVYVCSCGARLPGEEFLRANVTDPGPPLTEERMRETLWGRPVAPEVFWAQGRLNDAETLAGAMKRTYSRERFFEPIARTTKRRKRRRA